MDEAGHDNLVDGDEENLNGILVERKEIQGRRDLDGRQHSSVTTRYPLCSLRDQIYYKMITL